MQRATASCALLRPCLHREGAHAGAVQEMAPLACRGAAATPAGQEAPHAPLLPEDAHLRGVRCSSMLQACGGAQGALQQLHTLSARGTSEGQAPSSCVRRCSCSSTGWLAPAGASLAAGWHATGWRRLLLLERCLAGRRGLAAGLRWSGPSLHVGAAHGLTAAALAKVERSMPMLRLARLVGVKTAGRADNNRDTDAGLPGCREGQIRPRAGIAGWAAWAGTPGTGSTPLTGHGQRMGPDSAIF